MEWAHQAGYGETDHDQRAHLGAKEKAAEFQQQHNGITGGKADYGYAGHGIKRPLRVNQGQSAPHTHWWTVGPNLQYSRGYFSRPYSFSFLCSVLRLIPRRDAALVWIWLQPCITCEISSRSTAIHDRRVQSVGIGTGTG